MLHYHRLFAGASFWTVRFKLRGSGLSLDLGMYAGVQVFAVSLGCRKVRIWFPGFDVFRLSVPGTSRGLPPLSLDPKSKSHFVRIFT